MSKWSRLKVAALIGASTLFALWGGSCLGNWVNYKQILGLVAIGSIFD